MGGVRRLFSGKGCTMRKFFVLPLFAVAWLSFPAAAEETPSGGGQFLVKKIGDIEVVALLDAQGIREGRAELLVGAGAEDLERAARPGALATSINAFIVRLDGKTYLFDTGLPIGEGTGIGSALAAAGIAPDDIDVVIITHFHRDHVGGLLKDGKPVYPRAELAVPRLEVDKWSNPGTEFLTAYGHRSNAFDYDVEIYPGITSRAAVGHTPGHTVFLVQSGPDELLIVGDLIHIGGVQLPNPDVAVTYDVDPVEAVKARRRIFDMAADKGLPIASMHLPFPGMGVLAKEGQGYAFEELE